MVNHKSVMKLYVVGILALCCTSAAQTEVEISVDRGRTWEVFSKPLDNPPLSALLRVRGGLPIVTIPSCAMAGSLLIQVWKDAASDMPMGMRWRSKLCHPTASFDMDGVVIETIVPKTQTPHWNPYVHEAEEDKHEKEQELNLGPERKSWWNRYSLYIMLFIAVALAQGIRQGLAEIRKEMEREEEERKQRSRSGSNQMRVIVPTRKESRARKRSTANKTPSATS